MSASLHSGLGEKLSFSALVRELLAKVGELLSTQMALTKAEIKLESKKLVMAIVLGVGALSVGFLFLLFLGFSLILVFAQIMDVMWASLATSGVYLLVTALLTAGMVFEIRRRKDRMTIE